MAKFKEILIWIAVFWMATTIVRIFLIYLLPDPLEQYAILPAGIVGVLVAEAVRKGREAQLKDPER